MPAGLITPAEAEQIIRAHLSRFPVEACALANAHGRILRADVRADRDLPPFDRVTMDGYALRSSAVAAGAREFHVAGIQPAGTPAAGLAPAANACIEVMTGAVLPIGADMVVPYEDTERQGAIVRLMPAADAAAGAAVHRRGSDHQAGDCLIRSGQRITGREIAIAASVGQSQLSVATLPRIALIASGDELVAVDAAVAEHQIRRSNDHALRAALHLAGYREVDTFSLRDVRLEIEALLERVLADHDVIILTGGVSRGKFDFVPAALEARGVRRLIHGVAQRPGKPFWFGVTTQGQLVFALPGNPVSSYTCLHRYVLPALDDASGLAAVPPRRVALAEPAQQRGDVTYFLPVRLNSDETARLTATPCWPNTSGDLAGLSGTDGFVELPAGEREASAGSVVRFHAW